MRKLTSFLFISLDGVVESPNTFVCPNVYMAYWTNCALFRVQ